MSVSQEPLSVRNNNPGNLRYVGQEGAAPGEGGFATFESAQAGLDAMRKQIELDTQTRGLTLTQFLNKYAPPTENKTGNYIDFVVKRTGLDPAGRVPVEKIADLQTAMIEMEGGPRALSRYNLQKATPTQVARAPQTAQPQTAAQPKPTTPVETRPGVQVAAAVNPSDLPTSYTSALALNYLADTDPEGSVMSKVNQMMEELRDEGGATRTPGAATLQQYAKSARTDPFKLMAQAQEPTEQQPPQQRKAVPRMPVRMADGGPLDASLLEKAASGQRAFYRPEEKEWIAAREKEFEAYNQAVKDYNEKLLQYQKEAEAYNAIMSPYLSDVEAYNKASEEYNQNVYNPYVSAIEQYNQAMRDYEENVYKPYLNEVAAYNKALEEYNASVNAPYEQEVAAYNKAVEDYTKNVYDPYAAEVEKYNQALRDYEENVYNPYVRSVDEYNAAAEEYYKKNYPTYEADIAAYNKAADEYNAKLKAYEDYMKTLPEYYYGATETSLPYVAVQKTIGGRNYYTGYAGYDPLNLTKLQGVPQFGAAVAPPSGYEFVQTGVVPIFGEKNSYAAGYYRKIGAPAYTSMAAPGEFTAKLPEYVPYSGVAPKEPAPFSMAEPTRPADFTGVAPTAPAGFSGVQPTLKPFELSQPIAPEAFSLTAPVEPTAVAPTAPTGPTATQYTPEQFEEYVTNARNRAQKAAANRAQALKIAANPQQFGLSGLSLGMFAEGGEVNYNQMAEQMTVGTVPEGKSGVLGNVARDVVRGAQYLPYDLLGAPVDIATMAMRPFGYNVEKPVGGSEWLIEKSRQAGIADQPTGSLAETATRIGMGFVNPAAVARQIPKGIATLEKGVEKMTLPAFRQITGNPNATKEEMMDFVLNQKNIMQAGTSAIVKPKGGTFVSGEHSTFDNALEDITSSINREKQNWGYAADAGDMVKKLDTISDFFNTRFKNYYQKRLGSQDDPLRDAFVRGDFNGGDWFNVQELNDIRARIANPQTSSAQKEELLRLLNSKYDAWTDINAIVPERNSIGKKLAYPSSESVNIIQKKLKEQGVNVDKKDISVTAETRDNYLIGDKGLNAINQGDVAYDVGSSPTLGERADLIKDYLMTLNPNQIKNITFEDAIIGAERYHEALKNPAIKFTPQELFEGREKMFNVGDKYQWSEIKTVEALKREGLAMDHCIQGDDYCRQLTSGVGRHFSLQDAKTGIPHTTISTYRSPFAGPESKHVVIGQIKGHSNSIASKYFDQIEKFLEEYEKQVGKIYITEKPKFIPPAFKKAEYTQLPRGYEGNQYAKGGMVDKPLYDRAA